MGAKHVRSMVLSAALLAAASCVTSPYDPDLTGGDFSGQVILGWDDGYRFIYYPAADDPLVYVFPDGHPLKAQLGPIRPEAMYTDGGSIPRVLWSVDGLSAWEYGPAYILHDWLFLRRYCEKGDFKMTFEQANAVLLDAMIRTDEKLAQKRKRPAHERERLRGLIDAAVRNFGKAAWDKGECPPPVKNPFEIVTVQTKRAERVELASGRSVRVSAGQTYQKRVYRFRPIATLKVGGED